MSARSKELDAMTEADKAADILKNIEAHGVICVDNRSAVAFWGAAINSLKTAGKVELEHGGSDEAQYSYLKVSAA